MQQHINLKSANWIFADIQKMTEQNYIDLKSSDDRKKKIRRFFQSFGVNKFQTETEACEYFFEKIKRLRYAGK